MEVRITTRHATIGEALLRRAETRLRKLERYEPRLQAVSLLFDEDHGRLTVEARAEVPGVPTMVARSEGDASRPALDRALEKLRRQLRRQRSRHTAHQGPSAAALATE